MVPQLKILNRLHILDYNVSEIVKRHTSITLKLYAITEGKMVLYTYCEHTKLSVVSH